MIDKIITGLKLLIGILELGRIIFRVIRSLI